MTSFLKSAELPSVLELPRVMEQPIAAGGGIQAPVRHEEDPLKALDDLMAAIELLCPQWPAREPSVDGKKMLL